ncbi:MAG: spermidine/putrescine ABC transporter ATP-binding protein [Thermoflexus sp.]
MSSSENFLVVDGLYKRYKDIDALREVSFQVRQGEFFVIIGPSGSGKTTLLNCLAGLLFPDKGRILLGGEDITYLPPHKRGMSMIFQDFALFPHMTVAENIAFGLKLKGLKKDDIETEVKAALKMIGLSGYENRLPRQLSAGEKQRVAIARSLVVRPKVLLFDEPLANLDYRMQRRMEEELKVLHRKLGMTFIYVTHNQEQAMSLADRILVLNKGFVEQIGPPDEIYNRPLNLFVARFVGDLNVIRGKLVKREDNYAYVETAYGLFRGMCWDSCEIGADVAYSVRPERIRIMAPQSIAGRDEFNAIRVKLLTHIYKGAYIELVGLTGDNITLTARVDAKDSSLSGLQRGAELILYWGAEEAFVLSSTSKVGGLDIESVIYGG